MMLTEIGSDYTFLLVYFDRKNWIMELFPELPNPDKHANILKVLKNIGCILEYSKSESLHLDFVIWAFLLVVVLSSPR